MLGIGIGIGRRHPAGPVGAPVDGDPPEVSVNAVNFDGTNDYINRGADLTGNADGKLGISSFWLNLTSSTGTVYMFSAQGNFITIELDPVDKIVFRLWDSGATQRVHLETSAAHTEAEGWIHVLAAWDVGNAKGFLYITDVADLDAPSKIISDAAIDYTRTEYVIGAQFDGLQKLIADLAEFYLNTAEFLDISVESNRRKFISAGLKPVDLGADGSDPTGTAPIIYQTGATAAWHTNKGSGEGFTEVGALTDAATSPSD